MSTAKRRLAKVEAALSPTGLVVRWLAEAHAHGDLESYTASLLDVDQANFPLDRLGREAQAGAQERTRGLPPDDADRAVERAIVGALFRSCSCFGSWGRSAPTARVWLRTMPYWGDPFCAAYTTVWSRFYSSQQRDHADLDVGWDRLPEAVKSATLARLDEHDAGATASHGRVDDEDHHRPKPSSDIAARCVTT